VLAQMIRARIDRMLAPSLGALATLAASYRIAAEKLLPRGSARRRFWREFFAGAPARAMEVGHISEARRAATASCATRAAARAMSRWSAPGRAPRTS
jgi:uroporphyrin-III C-methyltransferase / precorrin-2 dehydrogenase / sirohydrochlorin ferrochelatase